VFSWWSLRLDATWFFKDSFPCFTRLNPCVAHCSTDSIPWLHHSREEGSLNYDGGFVLLQIHMKFDTNIYRQQASRSKHRSKRWSYLKYPKSFKTPSTSPTLLPYLLSSKADLDSSLVHTRSLWIQYPRILLGESYTSIHTLVGFSAIVIYINRPSGVVAYLVATLASANKLSGAVVGDINQVATLVSVNRGLIQSNRFKCLTFVPVGGSDRYKYEAITFVPGKDSSRYKCMHSCTSSCLGLVQMCNDYNAFFFLPARAPSSLFFFLSPTRGPPPQWRLR
jgi:hypothetical protein